MSAKMRIQRNQHVHVKTQKLEWTTKWFKEKWGNLTKEKILKCVYNNQEKHREDMGYLSSTKVASTYMI